MLATLLLLALLLPTSKVEGANGLFGGDSSLEDLGLTADCRSLVDERCFFGLGVPIHTGTPGEAQCEESCAVFPSMRSKKKCGSCQSEEQIKENTVVTYKPGRLNVEREGLLLSEGLTARILATSNQPVLYDTPAGEGSRSDQLFHIRPDMGATFPDPRTGNEGGWIYVSGCVCLFVYGYSILIRRCLDSPHPASGSPMITISTKFRFRIPNSSLPKKKPTGSKGASARLRLTRAAMWWIIAW